MKMILAWLVVAVPLGWGVKESVSRALPLLTNVAEAIKQKPAK